MRSLKSAVRTRRMTSLAVKLAVLACAALVLGFAAFVWFLPEQQLPLDRNADGIVVLTGGTSRITDALELLASGRGKRLLITGVNPGTTTADIAHQTVNYDRLLIVLRRPRLFRAEYARQCGSSAALGDRARFPFAHRRDVGLSHAARAGRTGPSASRRRPHPVPGGLRPPAHRAMVVEQRNDQTGAVGISQIPFRQDAHAVRFRRQPMTVTAAWPTRVARNSLALAPADRVTCLDQRPSSPARCFSTRCSTRT